MLHYAWIFAILRNMPLLNGLAYFMVGQTGCGLFLAIVFGLGHNGMAVYPADQVINLTGPVKFDWLSLIFDYINQHTF